MLDALEPAAVGVVWFFVWLRARQVDYLYKNVYGVVVFICLVGVFAPFWRELAGLCLLHVALTTKAGLKGLAKMERKVQEVEGVRHNT